MVDARLDGSFYAGPSRLPRWLLLTCVGILVVAVVWTLHALVLSRSQGEVVPGPLEGGFAELEVVTGIRFPESAELVGTHVQPLEGGEQLLAVCRIPHEDLDRFVKSLPAAIEIARDPANTAHLGIHEGFGSATAWWQPDLSGRCMVIFIPLSDTEQGRWVASKLIVGLDNPAHAGVHLQAYRE